MNRICDILLYIGYDKKRKQIKAIYCLKKVINMLNE